MSKLAIVTRADDNIKDMTDVTLPVMSKYAEKCGADFIVLSDDAPFLTEDNKPHYRILEIEKLFDKYDRILNLDADMLITNKCPNIFEVVPEDCIGSIYEDRGSRLPDRRLKIRGIQEAWGNVNWTEGYTNAGTFLLSKMHRDIFLPHNDAYWLAWGSADLHLSYNIHKYNFKVHELDYKWNHMTMFNEEWMNYPDRFESYIIHYAGGGVFDTGISSRLEQIQKDAEKLRAK
jgi:lipopolysaccharide biosynthesis glycosyltransferase